MKSVILILLLFSYRLMAQSGYDSSFRFYYYDQKLSMFMSNPTQNSEIIWLGDSITDSGEWGEFFPKKKVLNRGVSGDNTYGILYRIREVLRHKPKKLFLMIGINDIAKNIPDSIIIGNFKKIIDSVQLLSPKTKFYMQSILPTNNKFTNFKNHQNKTNHILAINSAIELLCTENKLTFVNLYKHFINPEGMLDEKYTNDGLHLLGEGYKKWKELLRKEISN